MSGTLDLTASGGADYRYTTAGATFATISEKWQNNGNPIFSTNAIGFFIAKLGSGGTYNATTHSATISTAAGETGCTLLFTANYDEAFCSLKLAVANTAADYILTVVTTSGVVVLKKDFTRSYTQQALAMYIYLYVYNEYSKTVEQCTGGYSAANCYDAHNGIFPARYAALIAEAS
jgi:hypothetical protein